MFLLEVAYLSVKKIYELISIAGGMQHVVGETYNAVVQMPMTLSSSLDPKTVSLK